jgi:hypothetical protein
MFTPSTNLRLLNVPLEVGYSDTLWFPDVNTQTQYFLGKVVKAINDFNFIKKDNTITINGNVETYYNCNYIMYQNTNFSNKWFYAFINRVEWASNSSTRLYCSTDCIQTWFFDITYYKSFIERQHVEHETAPDNYLATEPVSCPAVVFTQMGRYDVTPDLVNVYATCNSRGAPIGSTARFGIVSGCGLAYGYDRSNIRALGDRLNEYVSNGLASAVTKIQQVPKALFDAGCNYTQDIDRYPSFVGPYVPRNKKVLSGQFVKGYIALYGQICQYNPNGAVTPQLSVMLDPTTGTILAGLKSNNAGGNQRLYAVQARIPEATWAYNQYKNDYNLHSGSNSMYYNRLTNYQELKPATEFGDTLMSAIGLVAGLATGGKLGTSFTDFVNKATTAESYINGYDEITEEVSRRDESLNAPPIGSVSGSTPYIAAGSNFVTWGFVTGTNGDAQRLDEYFDMFGYQLNRVMIPNLHARKTWTYIKVTDLKASGDFPNEDFDEIRKAFNNGLTFWDYTKTFGDYSQDNTL